MNSISAERRLTSETTDTIIGGRFSPAANEDETVIAPKRRRTSPKQGIDKRSGSKSPATVPSRSDVARQREISGEMAQGKAFPARTLSPHSLVASTSPSTTTSAFSSASPSSASLPLHPPIHIHSQLSPSPTTGAGSETVIRRSTPKSNLSNVVTAQILPPESRPPSMVDKSGTTTIASPVPKHHIIPITAAVTDNLPPSSRKFTPPLPKGPPPSTVSAWDQEPVRLVHSPMSENSKGATQKPIHQETVVSSDAKGKLHFKMAKAHAPQATSTDKSRPEGM